MAGLDDLSLEQLQAMRAAKTGTVAPVDAVHQIESNAAPDTSRVVNPASGAQGSMQVMPTTQADPGFGVKPSNGTPQDTARAGRDYYAAMQQKYKDPVMAAVAYNWGPGNADKWAANGSKLDELPLETLKYIKQFKQKVEPAALPPTAQNAPQTAGAPQQDVAQLPDTATMQPSFLGRLGTGIGDFVGGATRGIVTGMGAIGDLVAPNSEFTKGAHAAIPQMDAQKAATDAAFAAKRQAAGQDTSGTDWVRVGGQMIPAFLIPGGAATGVGRLAAGAYGGAVGNMAMTQPGESYAKNAATGAGIGLAGAGLAAGIGKVMKGVNISPSAQTLIDQGVTPTPGDVMGGVAKSLESRATSIPIIGDAINSAKRASVQDMNHALYEQVLAPVGEQAPRGVGREAVEAIGDRLGDRYEALLPQVTFQVDNGFVTDMSQVSRNVASLPADVQQRFASTLDRNFFGKLTQGQMTGEELQKANSMLTQEAKKFGASPDPFHRDMADAVRETQDAIRGALLRANPQHAQELGQINTAYSRYAILRDAAKRVNNPENPIMPGQLQAAVKQADKSVGKGNFAKGNANLQGLSDPAMAVLGSSYPDSGTAGRMMLGSGLAGITSVLSPGTALGGAAATALYGTETGRKAMLAVLARRPEFARLLGNRIQSSAPQVGAALGAAYGANK